MNRRNTIMNSMLAITAAAAGSATAFGSMSLIDPLGLATSLDDQWLVDPIDGFTPWNINPNGPTGPTLIPNDVGHTDQGPVSRPNPTGGGNMAPLLAAASSYVPPSVSSSELADLLGRLDAVVLGGVDADHGGFGSTGSFGADSFAVAVTPQDLAGTAFSAPPSFAIPAPGTIVLVGLAGGLAGLRRRR